MSEFYNIFAAESAKRLSERKEKIRNHLILSRKPNAEGLSENIVYKITQNIKALLDDGLLGSREFVSEYILNPETPIWILRFKNGEKLDESKLDHKVISLLLEKGYEVESLVVHHPGDFTWTYPVLVVKW